MPYAEDAAVAGPSLHPATAMHNLRDHLDDLEGWLQDRKSKVNKYSAVHFTRRRKKGGALCLGSGEMAKEESEEFLGTRQNIYI
jgi:hypothetical protein